MKTIFTFILTFLIIFGGKSQSGQLPGKTYGLTFSFPWVNFYRYHDYELNNNPHKSGFFGLGLAGYCKEGKNKISFNMGFTEDLSSPIGAIDYSMEGKHSHIGCSYGELLFHRPIGNDFYAVAGFNYMGYKFQFTELPDNTVSKSKVDNTLGLSLAIEYRFNKYISAATFYRPALASFETDDIYRHLITLDIRVDVDVIKQKKSSAN